MRRTIAAVVAAAILTVGAIAAPTEVQARASDTSASGPTDFSARSRKRPRVYIYRNFRNADERGVIPSYFPGTNAVRDCTATYAQEFRPSGTVIVPRMSCVWRRP